MRHDGMLVGYIDLRNFSSITFSSISDVEADPKAMAWTRAAAHRRLDYRQVAIGEASVRQPIAEWKEWLCAVMFISPISYEDTFFINNPFPIRSRIIAIVSG